MPWTETLKSLVAINSIPLRQPSRLPVRTHKPHRPTLKQTLYYIGGVCIVLGALLPAFAPSIAPYVFGIGAFIFAPIQMLDRYEGSNLDIRRLRRQQVLGAFLLVVSAMLLFCRTYGIAPFRGNEWMIALLIATVLEAYSVFRIDHIEKKENNRRG